MALLALAMEIGAGLALYEARRHSSNAGEDSSHVAQELAAIQQCMVAKLEELRNAENAAAIFHNRFWRDFYRAIPEDEGYFQERITAARQALVQTWITRTRKLEPRFVHTDIFGALLLASQIFQNSAKGREVLLIFSDMRENAGNLKLESLKPPDVHFTLAKFAKGRMLPDLKGVEVYVLGADNAGKSMACWTALRDFWSEYFQSAGATLKTYTVLREPPQLTAVREGK
jgi:hypothetical protein